MAEEKVAPRCRIHFEQTAKGLVPRDVTGEAETPADAAKMAAEGLIELEKLVKARNLKFTDEVA